MSRNVDENRLFRSQYQQPEENMRRLKMKNDKEADNMDLHDFDDVAENYDLYLGEMFKDEDNNEEF